MGIRIYIGKIVVCLHLDYGTRRTIINLARVVWEKNIIFWMAGEGTSKVFSFWFRLKALKAHPQLRVKLIEMLFCSA